MNFTSIGVRLGRLLKLFTLKVGKRNLILGKNFIADFGVKIYNNANEVIIEENVYLRSIAKGYQASLTFPTTILLDVKGSRLIIKKNTRINGAYIHSQKSITIGENCVIASGVNIIDSNGHELISLNRTIGRDRAESIIIGNNVWIGLNAIILKGTIIGDNSVVSAGSVVKGIYPPGSLIVGNPGKIVKQLELF